MADILIGSEAVADGVVTSHELRRWYERIYPGVHAPRGEVLTLRDRTIAAWLWSRRAAIITGGAAAALHGSQWFDEKSDIELIWRSTRFPDGIIVRNERIPEDEWEFAHEMCVATVARTALDLGRFRPRVAAVAGLDALMRARPFSTEDVLVLAKRHRGSHGVARLKSVLPLVDGGAASPRESWLRILLTDAGFPAPATQILVRDEQGDHVRFLDMGWEEYKVAVEYDGDQHRTDRDQYVKDQRILRTLDRLGWCVVRVIKEDSPANVVSRTRVAMTTHGWHGAVCVPRTFPPASSAGTVFRV